MIQPNELRIGNCLMYNEEIYTYGNEIEEFIVTAKFIYDYGKAVDEGDSEYYDMIQPLLLTEERLIKFEFSIKELRNKMTKYNKEFDYASGFRDYITIIDSSGNKTGMYSLRLSSNSADRFVLRQRIKYVHQLQNLYFALTGEELKITK